MRRLLVLMITLSTILMMIGCGGGSGGSAEKKPPAPKEIYYMQVKANELMNDYIRDVGTAETKYKNKNMQITGQLVNKGQFKNSNNFYAVIANTFAAGRKYNVLVEYPVEKSAEINKLNYNDFVVVKGVCAGVVAQDDPTVVSVQIYEGRVANEGPQSASGNNNTTTTAPSAPANPAPANPAPTPVNNTQTSSNVPAITESAIVNAYHSSADKEGTYIHSALLTIDNDTKSCWAEGVQGLGIGENIAIHFNGTYKVSGMNIWTGHQKTEDLFYKNARPTAIRVIGSDGSNEVYNLNDMFGVQRVNFKNPINVSNVKIVVEKVAPGNKYEDTCIAEVKFF